MKNQDLGGYLVEYGEGKYIMSGRIDAQILDQEKSEEEEQKEPLRVEIDKDQKKTTVDICTLNKDAEKRKVHNDKINIVMFDQQGIKSCCVFMRKKNCSNYCLREKETENRRLPFLVFPILRQQW
nr:uncharacterized protein LOC105320485 isoform X5 [Crassostrea gigas]